MKITIAIDGPAGAGKSTVAKILADRLGLLYIDTGAMYRAATWLALKEQIGLEDGESLAEALSHKDLRLESPEESAGGRIRVFLNDHEITDAIRGKEVSDRVSTVAAQKMVRKVLVEQQRKLARGRSAVLDGRDIGTVVLPDADLKIFLTASAEERARRRVKDMEGLGEKESYDDVLRAIIERDKQDSTRQEAPLVKAADAVEVDTDGLTIEEVVDRIADLCKNSHNGAANL